MVSELMLSAPTLNPCTPTQKKKKMTRMGSSTAPLLSSNPPIRLPNPFAPAFTSSLLRRSQSVLSTQMSRFGGSLKTNADYVLRLSHRAKCYSSSCSSDTVRRWKGISLLKHAFGSQQSELKVTPLLLCVRTWKPRCVKSGEMEESSSSEGVLLDEKTLQRDLERAIEEENYSLAAKLRDDLRLLQDDSKAAVLAANAQFYEAFKNGDFVAMSSIWMEGGSVYIVHPGAGAISGYDLVMGSWEIICGADHEFPIMIDLKNVEVHVRGDVGYVTCLEVVKTQGSSWGRQVATNVFERVDGKWLMCIHHASHVDT